jgi:polyphosphate kinase
MNALVEPSVIDALYRAAQAGVTIDAVVRGICSMRAGLPGVSERVRVFSVVDKFLEHSRIFYFENAGNPDVFLGSADWMPRNFFRRIELMFPIEDPRLKTRVIDEILRILLSDNVKARQLQSDGTYVRVTPGEGELPVRSQVIFQTLARSGRESGEIPLQFMPPAESKGAPEGTGEEAPPRKGKRKGRVRIARQRDVATEPDSATG